MIIDSVHILQCGGNRGTDGRGSAGGGVCAPATCPAKAWPLRQLSPVCVGISFPVHESKTTLITPSLASVDWRTCIVKNNCY